MTSHAEAVRLIEAARSPVDLFGPYGDAGARDVHRRLARLTHPDVAGSAGAQAFVRLNALWREHARGPTITTRRRTYSLGDRFAAGDVANLYRTGSGRSAALLKLPRDPASSDLLKREATALTQLVADGDARFRPYVPRLVETFRHRDSGSGAVRQANVIELQDGFRTLAEVRAAHPDGLDPRDAAWMWRRLLVALGFAHRAGVLHGAVLPEHVLIHPRDHGLLLVDWCYSVPGCYAHADPSGRVPAVVRRYADGGWYPPEVAARERAGAGTDIAMATRCITWLLGDRITRPLRRFAAGCTLPAQSRRPQDAWRLLAELDQLLERLYGPRRFRPFAMPA